MIAWDLVFWTAWRLNLQICRLSIDFTFSKFRIPQKLRNINLFLIFTKRLNLPN